MFNIISANKKVTIPTSFLKSQNTSGSLGDFHINDCQKNRRRIRTSTLYLVFHNFQKPDKGFAGPKKPNQCNELSFCLPVRF